MNNLKSTLYLTLLVALSLSGAACRAAHLCWVEAVTRTEAGLTPHFSTNAGLRLNTSGARYVVSNGVIYAELPNGKKGPEAKVVMAPGDKASVSQFPEDGCQLEAVDVEGKAGLRVDAYSPTPTHQLLHSSQFIPAE